MKTLRLASLVLSVALVLTGCGGGSSSTADTLTDVAFTSLEQSTQSGQATLKTSVISTQAEWDAAWRAYTVAAVPPPAVDFPRQQVLAVYLGQRPSGCQTVSIQRVQDSATQRVVSWSERVPGPTELCIAVVVTPVHFVRISASTLPVDFRKL